MIAEFNVWLLIVGLVVGAGLVWLVMIDGRRRESDIDALELPREAAWLSAVLAEDGFDVSPEAAEQLLLLHRAYLGAPPPDPVVEEAARPEVAFGAPPPPEADEGPPPPEADEELLPPEADEELLPPRAADAGEPPGTRNPDPVGIRSEPD